MCENSPPTRSVWAPFTHESESRDRVACYLAESVAADLIAPYRRQVTQLGEAIGLLMEQMSKTLVMVASDMGSSVTEPGDASG